MRALRASSLVLTLALLAGPAPLAAQAVDDDGARCDAYGLDDADVSARLAEVRRHVERHEPDMRHWWSGFLVLHTVMAGAQVTFMLSADNDGQRAEFGVQGLSSLLGVVTLLLATPPLLGAGGTLDALPRDTPEARAASLAAAEALFRRSADAVSLVRGPVSSLLSLGYGEAASLTLLLAFQRPIGALLLAGGSAVIGQGRLFLHPWGIRDAWRAYLRAHPDAGCEAPPAHASVPRWSLGAAGPGLSFTLAF